MSEKSYLVGYILASSYRKKVLLELQNKELTPGMIAEKTDLYPEHVSMTLSQLEKKGLVVCTTPKLRKGRMYGLTKEGRNVLKYL